MVCSSLSPTRSFPGACRNKVDLLPGRFLLINNPWRPQQIPRFLSDRVENSQIKGFGADGQTFQHRAKYVLKQLLAGCGFQAAERRVYRHQGFPVLRDIVEPDELDIDQFQHGQGWGWCSAIPV